LKKDQKIIRSKIAREKRSSHHLISSHPHHLFGHLFGRCIFLEDDEDTHTALHDGRQGRARRVYQGQSASWASRASAASRRL